MKQFFILFIYTSINAQMTVNDRIDQQLKLSTFEYEGVRLLSLFQEIEPHKNILDYKSYIGYLFTNFTDEANKKGEIIKDVNKKENTFKDYRNRLKQDTLFVNTLQIISENSLKKIKDKPMYDFDNVLDVATKFIKIIDINAEGNYVLKICVGVNDLEKTQPKRFADIEAFCFMTIFNAYTNKNGTLKSEIINEFHKIVPINMGIDKQERILRAQGALMVLMYQNEVLKQVLKEEYEHKKELLPFKISD